jgi:RNA polymerase sigma-70 factor (ECF subfamily)
MDTRTDNELLTLTLRGDEGAATEVWSRWGTRLIAFATGLLRRDGGHAAACDVVQTVFCRILSTDRAAIAAVQEVGPWLARAVRNESLNFIRAADRRRAHTREVEVRGPGADPAGFDELHEALAALPEALREIVLLKHAAGLTFDQIALALGDNRNTIASRYTKALRLIREHASVPQAARQEVRA